MAARPQRGIIEIDFNLVIKVCRTNFEFAIFSRRNGGVRGNIDRRRHHETRVVVGMLADKVDAPWRAKGDQGSTLCLVLCTLFASLSLTYLEPFQPANKAQSTKYQALKR